MMSLCRLPLRLAGLITARNFSTPAGKLIDVTLNEKTGVSTVTLQRLPVNSLNLELLTELGQTFDSLEKGKCRGMILTSASPTVFSAGLDITEMYKPQTDRIKAFWTTLQNTWMQLYSSSFPTVAAINGHSPAGGCLLALSCEYRIIVGPKNTIGLNETRLGIIAPKWFQDCMRNVIGERQAELALTTGRMFSADEALKVSLVDEIAKDKSDAITKAENFLDIFKNIPGVARHMTKASFRKDTLEWLKKNQDADLKGFLDVILHPKIQDGLGMYLQSLKKT